MTRILLGIIAALVLLTGILAWREDRAVKQRNEARLELSAANASLTAEREARERDGKVAAELATIRAQTAASFRQFDETLRTSKVTREIRYVDKQGKEAVCTERDDVQYQRMFDEAIRGSPGS